MDYIKKINRTMKTQGQTDPYELLAQGVILQACQDLRCQLKIIKNDPHNAVPYARKSAKDVIAFFKSKQFTVLTSIDPEYILRKIYEEQGVSVEEVNSELNK